MSSNSESTNNNFLDKLETAKKRATVFQEFLKQEISLGANSEKLAVLDAGIENSPYQQYIPSYSQFLSSKPDGVKIFSSVNNDKFKPYPQIGQIPEIDGEALKFIYDDIKEACVCIGGFANGDFKSYWMGKNALRKNQFWSSTKIIAILNLISRINTNYPNIDIDRCVIRGEKDGKIIECPFYNFAEDVVSYAKNIASSNSIAAMFKRFETRAGLELWVKQITGNNDLEFQGDYGEAPFLELPELVNINTQEVLLKAPENTPKRQNLITAYDLTRLLSMAGWHHYINSSCQLPGVQSHSLESVIKAMGVDTARYADVAIANLGLENAIASPVIISKLGFGPSETRNTVELVYLALVQFIDNRYKMENKPGQLRSVCMTLRGEKPVRDLNSYDYEAITLDASMAAEVTELLRRIVTDEIL